MCVVGVIEGAGRPWEQCERGRAAHLGFAGRGGAGLGSGGGA